jgi:PAS domain S-box-containing protein
VNEAYEDLTGYSREELIGSTTSKVLDPEAMAERRELILELLNEESERQSHAWQSTLHTADNSQLPVEVNFAALEYGNDFIGIVGSARDISERRRREQELSVLSRVLRHNLGNKVNIIQGYAEVIEDHVADESALDYTERIRRTSEKLIQQSEKARDIHDLLQEWPPEKHPRDVTTVIWDVVTELEMEYPDVNFTLNLPDSAWARLPDQFQMAVEELLQNAIDHAGKDDPTVRVTVEAPEGDGEDDAVGNGTITIAVDDDGPGIPEHEIDVLSSEEETPLAHSEGIGLWMVTWIVNASDGELAFEESDLGGTRVRLEFPRTEPPALTLSM